MVPVIPMCPSAALPPAVGRTRRQGAQRHRSLDREVVRPPLRSRGTGQACGSTDHPVALVPTSGIRSGLATTGFAAGGAASAGWTPLLVLAPRPTWAAGRARFAPHGQVHLSRSAVREATRTRLGHVEAPRGRPLPLPCGRRGFDALASPTGDPGHRLASPHIAQAVSTGQCGT